MDNRTVQGRTRHAWLVGAFCAALLFALPATAAAQSEPLPPQGESPPGANDFACKPPPRHPFPIVLVHGTGANQSVSWNELTPSLTRLGYCVFSLDYGNGPIPGNNGIGDIPKSARQLQTFVEKVLSSTGAAKVSIVGHSQGGMMPRYLIKTLGFADRVDELVGLSSSNFGTDNPAAGPLGPGCPACAQQMTGSAFLTALNAGDPRPGPTAYTVVQTRNDEVVVPFDRAFLPGSPDGRVTNVLLQDKCPNDFTEHVGIIYDPIALQWVLNALGRPGPADPAFAPDCTGLGLGSYPDTDSTGASEGAPPAQPAPISTPAAQRVGLRIAGHASRLRETRRGSVSILLRGGGARVKDVVVTLRRAKAKRGLGKSDPVDVFRARSTAVQVSRSLKRGRYVAVAKGTAPNGSALERKLSFRLR